MQIGDTVKYAYSEFDGFGTVIGKITEIYDDHIIMAHDGIDYWFFNEDIGNMENDSMDVQVIPKEYVDDMEQQRAAAELMLKRTDLDPAEEKNYMRELSACETELKFFKNYLTKEGKFRTLGVDPCLIPGHGSIERKRR